MVAAANMVEVAALVGDTARATMLSALMGAQALTASELAARARIAKSTASGHLTKLVGARLLAVTQKRRNRYYRIRRRWWPRCWKASRPLLPLMFHPVISHVRPKMIDYVSRAPATIIWQVNWGWLSPPRLFPKDTSSSLMTVVR